MSLKCVLCLTVPHPHRQGSRQVPVSAPVASRARPRPAQGRRGTGRHGRVAAGTVGHWRYQAVAKGPEAARKRQAKAPRSSRLDGAGEAYLL